MKSDATGGAAAHDLVPLLIDYLDDVAARVAERLGPIAGVAVTLGLEQVPTTVGSSSTLAFDVDQLQYSIGTGPCLHALRTGVGLYIPDLARDDRWGAYGPRAAALGAASCVSAPVRVGARVLAVVKGYAAEVDGFRPDQRSVVTDAAVEVAGGISLAQHLTRQAQEIDDRVAAMNTRRTIDLALGMLSERTGCSIDEAFGLLRRYSQQYNVKLTEAARQVVGTRLEGDPAAVEAPFHQVGQPLSSGA